MMGNRPKTKKISILCEGEIEFNYFSGYKKQNKHEGVNIEIKKLPSAAYISVTYHLQRSPYVGIPLIILDLDRIADPNEHKNLDKLIAEVKRKKGFLFLTYKCFEDWIQAHFKKGKLETIFAVQGKSDLKQFLTQCPDLYQEIQKRGGSMEIAKSYYSSRELYLNLDFQKREEHLMSKQSSLYLWNEVLKSICSKN